MPDSTKPYEFITIGKTEFSENHIDILLAVVKQLQDKCIHESKLNTDIRLQRLLIPENVWIEANAIHEICGLEGKPIEWKCGKCSLIESYTFCLCCPFCFAE